MIKYEEFTADSSISFSDCGLIEINFVEMGRQCSRIEEVKNNITGTNNSNISEIKSSMNELASLIDYSLNFDFFGLDSLSSDIDSVVNYMNYQMENFKTQQEWTGNEIDKLNNLVNYTLSNNDDAYNQKREELEKSRQPVNEDCSMTDEAIRLSHLFEYGNIDPDSDGDGYYIIYSDFPGAANQDDFLSAGYGVLLRGADKAKAFAKYGVDIGSLHLGDTISKDIVDAVEKEEYAYIANTIKTGLEENNINLNQSQIDALSLLLYNTNSDKTMKNFVETYNEASSIYSANQDEFYDYLWNNFWKQYYYSNGQVVGGLQRRRAIEYDLFVNGNYYPDNTDISLIKKVTTADKWYSTYK